MVPEPRRPDIALARCPPKYADLAKYTSDILARMSKKRIRGGWLEFREFVKTKFRNTKVNI